MKKTLLSMLLVASCFGTANAQLMVGENGHIGLNMDTTAAIMSDVGINTLGSTGIAVSMVQNAEKHEIGLQVNRKNQYPTTGKLLMSIVGVSGVQEDQHNIGVLGRASSGTMHAKGRSFGVIGIGGGATSGWNYGVCGMLTGNNGGAGVYGSSSWDNGTQISGHYSGYFNGDVAVTETLEVPSLIADVAIVETVTTPSDYRLKENIKSVESSALQGL